jgi:two-component system KDP operon response regulator KdpE
MMDSSSILLVDDTPAIGEVVTAALRSAGYAVDVAGTSKRALELVDSKEFAAVLLDLGLPDSSGEELVQAVRRMTDAPIMIVSGQHDEGTRIRCLEAGADGYLAKPFRIDELVARVAAMLRRQRLR